MLVINSGSSLTIRAFQSHDAIIIPAAESTSRNIGALSLCRADCLNLFNMMVRSKTTREMQWSDQASRIEPMVGPSTGYTHDLISDNAKTNDVSIPFNTLEFAHLGFNWINLRHASPFLRLKADVSFSF